MSIEMDEESIISKLTYAMLESTGWYRSVPTDSARELTWGYKKTCKFFESPCSPELPGFCK